MEPLLTREDAAAALNLPLARMKELALFVPFIRVGRLVRYDPQTIRELAKKPDVVAGHLAAFRRRNAERICRDKYGISHEQRDRLLAVQGGVCAVCSRALTKFGSGSTHACIDHCHSTGKVRGILCGGCNKGLGHFRDNPESLARAAEYLRGV